jgi:hypothetical protein
VKLVVVDLGCATQHGVDSLTPLAQEYQPELIYGFDGSRSLDVDVSEIAGVPVKLARKVAWIEDGTLSFHEDGWGSRIGPGDEVECFDFSRWLRRLRRKPVVKMDIEGAEVAIVEKMIADGTDRLVRELLVEWHGSGEELEAQLHCPVRRWWL